LSPGDQTSDAQAMASHFTDYTIMTTNFTFEVVKEKIPNSPTSSSTKMMCILQQRIFTSESYVT
jgi:hypothetical protein